MTRSRSRSRARLTALVGLVALLVFLAPGGARPPAAADEPNVDEAISQQEEMAAELARQRSQLDALRRQQAALTASLASLTADLDAVGIELETAIAKLEIVTERLEQSRDDLRRYRREIDGLEEELREVADDIDQSEVDLARREALLEDHLREAYEQSQTSMLEILLSADSFDEASSQLSYMLTMSDEDRRLAEEIRAARERLEIRRRTLRDGRETLEALRVAEAERVASLASQQAAVDAARRELRAYQRRLAALQASQQARLRQSRRNAAETQDLIAAQRRALEGQRRLVERLKRRADRLDLAYHGRFRWPERGEFYVTQEFGHTSFDENHTGIDMAYRAPACGGPIYAAADGTVLADGRPNTAYGDTAIGVIIGHSQRLQTWYWHLSRETVRVGQEVETGDLIGYEGATGLATGCHLHFEVLFDGEPVNPRRYLP
jgi:murein DD-endopeptidase MepM/ murein hydrolase activator NlpD